MNQNDSLDALVNSKDTLAEEMARRASKLDQRRQSKDSRRTSKLDDRRMSKLGGMQKFGFGDGTQKTWRKLRFLFDKPLEKDYMKKGFDNQDLNNVSDSSNIQACFMDKQAVLKRFSMSNFSETFSFTLEPNHFSKLKMATSNNFLRLRC